MEEDGVLSSKSARAKFTEEDMLALKDSPELLDDDQKF
jgi:hypothetical protein